LDIRYRVLVECSPVKKILIMGLPGAGKTTIAKELAKSLSAVHLNADEIRREIHRDLGFSELDRIEHAKRLGVLCNIINRAGISAIADFVCPTIKTREAFGLVGTFVIWADRIDAGRYEDTNRLFIEPEQYDIRITAEGSKEYWDTQICNKLFALK